MMGEPDFIIAGGHKCGTTSLMRTLERHSDVERPRVDEPHTLIMETYGRFVGWNDAASGVADRDEYRSIHSVEGKTCDGSVLYLSHAEEFIRNYGRLESAPPVVVVLRDPVRRAWSAYNYARLLNPLEGEERFVDAIGLDEVRLEDPTVPTVLSYLSVGNYAPNLRILQDALGDSLQVVIFEELTRNPTQTLERLQRHVGLEPEELELEHSNPGGRWKHDWMRSVANSEAVRRVIRRGREIVPQLNFVTERLQKAGTTKLSLDAATEVELRDHYRPGIIELEKLLQLSLQELWS